MGFEKMEQPQSQEQLEESRRKYEAQVDQDARGKRTILDKLLVRDGKKMVDDQVIYESDARTEEEKRRSLAQMKADYKERVKNQKHDFKSFLGNMGGAFAEGIAQGLKSFELDLEKMSALTIESTPRGKDEVEYIVTGVFSGQEFTLNAVYKVVFNEEGDKTGEKCMTAKATFDGEEELLDLKKYDFIDYIIELAKERKSRIENLKSE